MTARIPLRRGNIHQVNGLLAERQRENPASMFEARIALGRSTYGELQLLEVRRAASPARPMH